MIRTYNALQFQNHKKASAKHHRKVWNPSSKIDGSFRGSYLSSQIQHNRWICTCDVQVKNRNKNLNKNNFSLFVNIPTPRTTHPVLMRADNSSTAFRLSVSCPWINCYHSISAQFHTLRRACQNQHPGWLCLCYLKSRICLITDVITHFAVDSLPGCPSTCASTRVFDVTGWASMTVY